MANSAIEFEVLDYDRFGMLTRVFYELLACERDAQLGRLEFRPLAGPFGGTDALKALVEAFGFRVVGEIE